jgi:serine/threonine protein kinase
MAYPTEDKPSSSGAPKIFEETIILGAVPQANGPGENADKLCLECGAANRWTARFCRFCGTAYYWPETSLEPQARSLGPGVLVDGRYTIERTLGESGTGRIYLATDRTGRRYALKQIRERSAHDDPAEYQTYVRSFQREANILSSLPHPYLPIARDFIMTPDELLIVMDYIEGCTLAEVQAQTGAPLSENRVLHWAVQICEALSYLHNKKPAIIHRNLKPKNIILEPGEPERVRLTGFGLARFYTEGLERDEDTLGTRGYAPPEQYGLAQTDHRSDIFSLGATIFALLTYRDPAEFVKPGAGEFPEINFPELRLLNGLISPSTSQVVMKALSLDPAQRYQTSAEMRQALEEILASQQPPSTPLLKIEQFILNQPVTLEETRHCEFKEVKGDNPMWAIKRIVDEYIVAFLNSEGGHIFWGIRDNDRIVVGVRLTYKQRDAVRKLITDRIFQIQPAVSPNCYHITMHQVFENEKPRKDLFVVGVSVMRPATDLLYFTGAGDVYVKTDAGRKKLSGSEIHDEILRRLQRGAGINPLLR